MTKKEKLITQLNEIQHSLELLEEKEKFLSCLHPITKKVIAATGWDENDMEREGVFNHIKYIETAISEYMFTVKLNKELE